MPELSLNILDLAENSFTAGASIIEVKIEEDTDSDTLSLTVRDNGIGMDADQLKKVSDPLYSTKEQREWGLGIPFLQQTADLCSGKLLVNSAPGQGTEITLKVQLSHIDRPPLGDLPGTIAAVIAGHEDKNLSLIIRKDSETYNFQTEVIRSELGEIRLSGAEILDFIERDIAEGLRKLEFVQ